MPGVGKSIETLNDCQGKMRQELRGKWGMTANRYGVSFGNDENVLKLIMMMVV